MYLIAASPLAKIFQPHFHKALIANPKLMFEMDGTEIITVLRPSSNINFELGKPKIIGGPEGSDKSQDVIELRRWLCGGENGQEVQETECYGIVDLNIHSDLMSTIAQLVGANPEEISKATATKAKSLEMELREKMAKAKVMSEARVRRAIRRVWSQFEDQKRKNAESGAGEIEPSAVEYLCAFALRQEIEDEKAQRSQVVEEYNKLTRDIRKGKENL